MPYNFTAEDFEKFTQDILGAEGDQASLTSLMADMRETVYDTIKERDTEKEEYERMQEENKRLLATNLELFTRRVDPSKPQTIQKPEEPEQTPSTKQYMLDYFAKLDKKE